MISVEFDSPQESIEIILDADGAEELIKYLNFIVANDESIHLVSGSELRERPIVECNSLIRHVKLVFLKKSDFDD